MPQSRSARKSTAPLVLTATEQAVLAAHAAMLDGLASYLGSGYECVLHSLESLEHSVIKIVNGAHSGRAVGAPVTDLALSMLSRIEQQGGPTHIAYASRTPSGEPLYSSTIAIQGPAGRTIGLLCINLYLNTPMQQMFTNMFQPAGDTAPAMATRETFALDAEEAVRDAVAAARQAVDADHANASLQRNRRIVALLVERGVFRLKGSVPRVARLLGISPNTVYLHLRRLQE